MDWQLSAFLEVQEMAEEEREEDEVGIVRIRKLEEGGHLHKK